MAQVMIPSPLNGFGTLALTATPAALSTVSKGTNSNAYPTTAFPSETITITNQGTGTAIFYPFGGSTTGIQIPLNGTRTFNVGGTLPATPNVASGTTATITVEW